MNKLLKDCFTQGDNETWSIMRIFVVLPSVIIFNAAVVIFSVDEKLTLIHIALAYLIYFLACGVASIFFKLYEDGTVKSTINKITEKVNL